MMSDDHAPISPSESNETDDTTYFMPWLKVILICFTLLIIITIQILQFTFKYYLYELDYNMYIYIFIINFRP